MMGAVPVTVVLVEGVSAQVALTTLARRRGRDLEAARVEVVAMGGITNIGAFARALGPHGLGLQLAGLCDAGEEPALRRRLARAGYGDALTRHEMEQLGYFVCERDLEDELIRAAGVERVQEVISAQGELDTFRSFQNQVFWRGRPVERQLRRWLQNGGRYLRYPPLLIEAMERNGVPRPLVDVLAAVG